MLPKLKTSVPGPRSKRLARQLAKVESHNVTFLGSPGPIFWEKAQGSNVWDVDDNRFLDLTSAFGVASLGHTSDRIKSSIQKQSSRLFHGMGDVHPTELKVELLEQLSKITFERWSKGRIFARSVLCNAGFEAVEVALKTALLCTGKKHILAFKGGYHGLGYGALKATWRPDFRRPFSQQLPKLTSFLPFPTRPDDLGLLEKRLIKLLKIKKIGAVVVEPVQGRAGIIIPPLEFLPMLRQACDRSEALLIVDEIFTGFWRTGKMFAVEHSRVIPDMVCLGKALSGALPLSACVGKKSVMQAWPKSTGEALHTSTFMGNPLACAAALASIKIWKAKSWKGQIALRHRVFREALEPIFHSNKKVRQIRGIGLMFGIEVAPGLAPHLFQKLLRRGIIALPAGSKGEVLSITPPLSISLSELRFAAHHISHELS